MYRYTDEVIIIRDTRFFCEVNTLSLLCHKRDSSEIHWSYFHLGSL